MTDTRKNAEGHTVLLIPSAEEPNIVVRLQACPPERRGPKSLPAELFLKLFSTTTGTTRSVNFKLTRRGWKEHTRESHEPMTPDQLHQRLPEDFQEPELLQALALEARALEAMQ